MSPRHSALRALGQVCRTPGSTQGSFWARTSPTWAGRNGLRSSSKVRPIPAFTRGVSSDSVQEPTSEPTSEPTDDSNDDPPDDFTPFNLESTRDGSREPSLSRALRLAMRAIPHPIALISCNAKTGPAGMLVSSFNTVTFNPCAYISFNVKLPSQTYTAIGSTRTFSLHALNLNGIWLAQAFLEWKVKPGARWPGVPRKEALMDHVGVKFTLMCEWVEEKSVEVGDHVVVVAKVLEILERKGAKDWGDGLIYSQGQYRRAGKLVDPRGFRPGSGGKL